MTKYICHTRYKGNSISGEVNIPAKTEGFLLDGYVLMNNKIIGLEHSEVVHQHFAINDDGNGMKRGKLTQEIQKRLQRRYIDLEEPDPDYQKRWDKVWKDKLCNSLRQKAHEDFFLWDNDFFTASIEDLEHILNLIKEV